MRMAASIKMDSKIRELMTNDGDEDQSVLEQRGQAVAILIQARDALDALIKPTNQTLPESIKITVREDVDF